ncbi:MAG: nicotinate-nucleotide--dimethylbenzimidazole phosphoribosyltransferase [Rivularia sp. T60_A2020_040]|nr:nicotinate-nucleotide--dimethylbenzimidazole phosphoribosyltransferase [Rivularia sp. T60_A2020_040]
MLSIYTNITQGEAWVAKYKGKKSAFACVLGFTETGLIPGISAAGSTPEDRKYTALADAEFLYYGTKKKGQYPLPPLIAGASPVFITRAVVETLNIPVYLFNAGLLETPTVPTIDLGGVPAKCLSQGAAMDFATVQHLLNQGMIWGERLSRNQENEYLVIGECVVGGTTTALAILTGLGIAAQGMVNSSHPVCNHAQKWEIVQAGLKEMGRWGDGGMGRGGDGETRGQGEIQNPSWKALGEENLHPKLSAKSKIQNSLDPLRLVAGVGDPMQVAVAGMAIAASRHGGVMLAGGTQMLAVFALASAIAQFYNLSWQPEEVVIGTTRWVAEDSTCNTTELAQQIGRKSIRTPSLLATGLCFDDSRYVQLQAYEQGFVKEGMGAGGACIAAYLIANWQQHQFIEAIEAQLDRYEQT